MCVFMFVCMCVCVVCVCDHVCVPKEGQETTLYVYVCLYTQRLYGSRSRSVTPRRCWWQRSVTRLAGDGRPRRRRTKARAILCGRFFVSSRAFCPRLTSRFLVSAYMLTCWCFSSFVYQGFMFVIGLLIHYSLRLFIQRKENISCHITHG